MGLVFLPKWLRTILKEGVVATHLSRLPSGILTERCPDEIL